MAIRIGFICYLEIREGKMKCNNIYVIIFVLMTFACSNGYEINRHQDTEVTITPDYKDITVPCNIAPLNFSVNKAVLSFVKYETDGDSLLVEGKGGQTDIRIKKWHAFLKQAQGKQVNVTVVVKQDGIQIAHKPFSFYVSLDSIDEYLAYRLIEPGYAIWNQMGIYQRNLTNFEETPIIENKITKNNCVNCHSFCERNPEHYLFHMRSTLGGTVFVDGNSIDFVNTQVKETISPLVYPYWHLSGDFVAFSTNKTSQGFHPTQRVEVYDLASDVVVYQIKERTIISSPRLSSKDSYETFPTFSPDGKYLYFCTAQAKQIPDSIQSLKYSLCRVSFDEMSGSFGESIDTLFYAGRENKSFSFPRISPDGRFLLGTVSDYGTFPIWHKDADLYLINLRTGKGGYVASANSQDTESYHSWSSNGRWVVFSSRRLDGLYTRPYLVYVSSNGTFGKPFLLPQENVDYYNELLKSYNIPEFITGKVDNKSFFIRYVAECGGENVRFRKAD